LSQNKSSAWDKLYIWLLGSVSFSPKLWGRWVCNHSRKDLANFIYKLERKVGKFSS
jgi:hypothetical protein